MPRFIEGVGRGQVTLLPVCLDDYVSEDNPVTRQLHPTRYGKRTLAYLKVIGWGWFYLSTILDDYSR